jgi:HEAT repeat protein
LDSSLRLAALQALAQIGGNEVLPPLRQSLRDDDVDIRLAAIQALAKLQDKNALPEILSLIRTERDPEVRQTALEVVPALATPGDATADQLIPLLQDSTAGIRRETVNALSKLGYATANAQLIRLLKNDPDDRVRLSAAYALGRLFQESDSQAVEKALSEALKKDKQGTVREAATYSLGQIGGRTAEKRLRDALDADDPNVRRAAAEALGNLRSQSAVSDLIKLLKHQNPELRRAAAIAVGKIGDPKAVEPLLYAVKDENSYVRMAVENALREIQAVAKESALLKALQYPSARVRVEAVEKLAATKSGDVAASHSRVGGFTLHRAASCRARSWQNSIMKIPGKPLAPLWMTPIYGGVKAPRTRSGCSANRKLLICSCSIAMIPTALCAPRWQALWGVLAMFCHRATD